MRIRQVAFIAVVVAATSADVVLLGQRQGGPAPAGRQGGAAPPAGRQGDPGPQGRQGGPQGGGQGGRQGAPRPARDRAATQGTAILRGRVVSAETGAPVRRAEVQVSGGQRARGALTDADGRFELRDLPAGSWNVRVSKTGFVTQQYGQRAPFAPSEPVTLADNQQANVDFAMLRGGAIMGRVFDDFGEPLANVRVTALRAQLTPNGRRLVSSSGLETTDDTGAYRLHGLAPGLYYVSAVPQGNFAGGGALSTAEGAITYGPTYFPGTTDVTGAQRVTLIAGQEQPNIDFAVTAQPSVRVSGIVLGMNGTPIQAMVNLRVPLFDDVGGSERRNANSNADGSFTLQNVPPGNYTLEVTGRSASRDVAPEVAAMPLTVANEITGLTITTSRGATITGTIAAEAAGARVEMAGIRVTAPPLRAQQGGWTPRAQATSTGSFILEGLIGAHALRFEQLPSGFVVHSITANGVDVTDVPIDFRGTEQVSMRVVLTNRVTEVGGTVSADVSPRGAGILVFPEDKSKWVSTSRYLRTARAGEKGEFTLRALPGNQRYLAVALDYLESGEQLDPEFLERVKPLATSFSLADGEQKRLELKLSPRP